MILEISIIQMRITSSGSHIDIDTAILTPMYLCTLVGWVSILYWLETGLAIAADPDPDPDPGSPRTPEPYILVLVRFLISQRKALKAVARIKEHPHLQLSFSM